MGARPTADDPRLLLSGFLPTINNQGANGALIVLTEEAIWQRQLTASTGSSLIHKQFEQHVEIAMAERSELPAIPQILDKLLALGDGEHCLDPLQRQAGIGLELCLGGRFKQAEAVHKVFEWQIVCRHLPLLVQIGATLVQIPFRMLHLGSAQDLLIREIGHLAMGATADPQIVTKAPVVEIVMALVALFGISRDLVLAITAGGEHGVALLVDIPQGVIFRQFGRLGGKRRVRLYGELIPGEVRRGAVDSLLQVIKGVIQTLIRQTVHQIQIESGQLDGVGQCRRLARLFRAVNAAEAAQLLLLEALHPDGDTVDAGALETGELVRLHRTRVRLHGDLAICGERNAGPNPVQQGLHRLHRQQAGGAAADKDRGERPPLCPLQILIQILQQGGDIFEVRQLPLLGMGVEVTVRALLDAPGHMNIERERRQLQHGASNKTGAQGPHCR
ncbi:hypothetical protein AERO8C_90050 [Aeromonas veronii]|uniref:Uncharacterized protein n=1 Tax=Aeromonas veronii TaxID=654 RepID=A0A653LCL3_AERVE|nr:hypothetical protein AERO8C_90050 [Aeromonas veronii]